MSEREDKKSKKERDGKWEEERKEISEINVFFDRLTHTRCSSHIEFFKASKDFPSFPLNALPTQCFLEFFVLPKSDISYSEYSRGDSCTSES